MLELLSEAMNIALSLSSQEGAGDEESPQAPGDESSRSQASSWFGSRAGSSWLVAASLVAVVVLSLGIFETLRSANYMVHSPCEIVDTKLVDAGSCVVCDDDAADPEGCQQYTLAAAQVAVSFVPYGMAKNVTSYVPFCWGRQSSRPCGELLLDRLDQYAMDQMPYLDGVECTAERVMRSLTFHNAQDGAGAADCYYNTRDPGRVWLSMPPHKSWLQDAHPSVQLLGFAGVVVAGFMLMFCVVIQGAEVVVSGVLPIGRT